MCCPASLQGRTSLAAVLPQLSATSGSPSAAETLLTAVFPSSPHWARLRWATFTPALLARVANAFADLHHSSSSPPAQSCFQFLPFAVVEPAEHTESDLTHCDVCQSPCHSCQMINPRNPGAETGMPGSSRNDIRGPQYFSL